MISGSSLVMMSSIVLRDDDCGLSLSVDSSFLYDATRTTVIRYFGSCAIISIPSTVREIGESSFCDSNVRRVQIPKSVEVIEPYSFSRCKSLERIDIESGSFLHRIESSVVAWSSLQSIVLPK
jgi:hypothetical protein